MLSSVKDIKDSSADCQKVFPGAKSLSLNLQANRNASIPISGNFYPLSKESLNNKYSNEVESTDENRSFLSICTSHISGDHVNPLGANNFIQNTPSDFVLMSRIHQLIWVYEPNKGFYIVDVKGTIEESLDIFS